MGTLCSDHVETFCAFLLAMRLTLAKNVEFKIEKQFRKKQKTIVLDWIIPQTKNWISVSIYLRNTQLYIYPLSYIIKK